MALGRTLQQAREDKNLTPSEVAAVTNMKVQVLEALENEQFDKIAAPIYGKGFIRMYAQHLGLDPQPLIDEYSAAVTGGRTPSLRTGNDAVPAPARRKRAAPAAVPESPPPEDLFADEDTDKPPPAPSSTEDEPEEKKGPSLPEWLAARASEAAQGASAGLRRAGGWTAEVWRGGRDKAAQCRASCAKLLHGYKFNPSGVKLSESPWRLVSAIIGIVLVLVFIVSSVSHCGRKADRAQSEPAADEIEQLLLATEPPDTFVE